jgi:hypothetical protein
MRFTTIAASLLSLALTSAAAVPTHKYSCNLSGFIERTGAMLPQNSTASTPLTCSQACASNVACHAISYDSTNGCKLFSVPVQQLEFSTTSNPNALLQYASTFWNQRCFGPHTQTASATTASATQTSSSSSTSAAATSTLPLAAAVPTCTSTTSGSTTYTQYFSGNGVSLSASNPGASVSNPKDGRYVKEILYGVTDPCEAISTCAGLSQYYGWVFGSFDVHYMQAEQYWVCSTFANGVTAAEADAFWGVQDGQGDVGVAYGFSI